MCDATSALFFCHLKVGSVGPSEAFLFFSTVSRSGRNNFACLGVFKNEECLLERNEKNHCFLTSHLISHLSYTSSEIRVKWRNMSRIHRLVSGTASLPFLQVELLLIEMLKIVSSLKNQQLTKTHAFCLYTNRSLSILQIKPTLNLRSSKPVPSSSSSHRSSP